VRTTPVATIVLFARWMMASNAYAEENINSDRVFFVASTKWHLIRDKAVEQNILLFRKYAFPVIDDKQRVEIIDVKMS